MAETESDLEAIAQRYDPSNRAASFEWQLKRLQVEAMRPWFAGDEFLELGCATGELASLLIEHARRYTVIEGSEHNIKVASERVPTARFLHGRWEATDTGEQYSDVICSGTLEHAPDPLVVLRRCHDWLPGRGRLHVCVPNGMSIHRQVAVEMGMISTPWELNESDMAQGHFRNYTLDTLTADIRATGWRVVHVAGIFLKVVPGGMMLDWPPDLVSAIGRVARRYPELGAELYVVAEPAES